MIQRSHYKNDPEIPRVNPNMDKLNRFKMIPLTNECHE